MTVQPESNRHPADLTTVLDVYGHRHRVRAAHLADGRPMLRRYNQHGQPVQDLQMRMLARENIAQTSVKPPSNGGA